MYISESLCINFKKFKPLCFFSVFPDPYFCSLHLFTSRSNQWLGPLNQPHLLDTHTHTHTHTHTCMALYWTHDCVYTICTVKPRIDRFIDRHRARGNTCIDDAIRDQSERQWIINYWVITRRVCEQVFHEENNGCKVSKGFLRHLISFKWYILLKRPIVFGSGLISGFKNIHHIKWL